MDSFQFFTFRCRALFNLLPSPTGSAMLSWRRRSLMSCVFYCTVLNLYYAGGGGGSVDLLTSDKFSCWQKKLVQV
ncbi:unnamed protein product [Calypogeia fissa]